MTQSPWIAHRTEKPQSRLRLFCFHHAGGAAHLFRTWGEWLPPSIEVCPVQLPGRATRMGEPLVQRLEPLVHAAVASMATDFVGPFAFFGHSLGSLLAFEIARELRRRGKPGPAHLFAAARVGPAVPLPRSDIHQLADGEFLQALQERYNAIPPEIAREPELLAMMLPILRADFTVHETYAYRKEPPLDCPISAYGANSDTNVPERGLDEWRAETSSAFSLQMVDGDHFFVHAKIPAFMNTLSDELNALVRGLGATTRA